jgi:hypothetical protein
MLIETRKRLKVFLNWNMQFPCCIQPLSGVDFKLRMGAGNFLIRALNHVLWQEFMVCMHDFYFTALNAEEVPNMRAGIVKVNFVE